MSRLAAFAPVVNKFAIVALMEISLTVIALMAVSSLLTWLPLVWRARNTVAIVALLIEASCAIVFQIIEPSVWSVLFATASLYKVVNLMRLLKGRIEAKYLLRVSFRAAALLTIAQLVLLGLAGLDNNPDMTPLSLAYVTAITQLLIGIVLFSSTSRHLRTTKTLQATTAYTDRELPSVSVLVPARNETEDLQLCLEALIASNYPKLEIIVLDDCSQSKRTPEIIRSFAHSGVRFIAGKVPNDSWLAKNYAYQQLADASNGEYLLFCGVDVQMNPDAIRELITTMLEKKKTMLSILPHNTAPQALRSLLIQPMRYAWELSLPRRLFRRPAVLSTCWVIKRDALTSAGSFKATSRSILPESYFARATARHDGYSFLRSNLLVSNKPAANQRLTAIRMRYPQLHRRIELVWALTLIELIGLVLPLPLGVGLLIAGWWTPAIIALTAFFIQYVILLQVTGVMYGRPMIAVGPWQPLYDSWLLNYSMYRYEFSEVIWKDRNICMPVMRQVPIPGPESQS